MRFLATKMLFVLAALALMQSPAEARPNPKPKKPKMIDSMHNLSASSPGRVRAFGEQEICIFCHTPHNAAPATPGWNRALPVLVYTPYSSSTLEATTGQPTSDSKLCLSCHDGTIALGRVRSRAKRIPVAGPLSARLNLTTDLSDDHPVSFVYDSALAAADQELVSPHALPESVRLDEQGEMQCTTCHESHSSPYPKLLVVDNTFSGLCVTCHDKDGWVGSGHEASPATWNGAGIDPWPHTEWTTVAQNGCENCHAPHAAGTPERLLNFPIEELNCLSCHNGSVARENIAAELQKPYGHSVDSYFGVHDPIEDFAFMPRHVECEDCHNPHAATSGTAFPPNLSGPLAGVAGVTSEGVRIENANYGYEVCFRCHSDNPAVPAPTIERQILEPNIRLMLDTSNPSFHPVEGPGLNPDVPSLIQPLNETSIISCTDCHANESGPGAGSSGPSGPHGSVWPFLLEREYRTADGTRESYQAYAMCYKCHDQQNILDDRSFDKHKKHIDEETTPCSVCHDPHGISSTQGSMMNNSHLINFDTSIVQADPGSGLLMFEDLGNRRGRCYLKCHEKEHSPEEYPD